MSNESNQKEVPVYKKGWFWLVIFLILLFWGANWVLVPMFICNPDDGGTFGDRFGAVNSLFTGFTILGLIITIVLQQKQISIQRDEITNQQKESTAQKLHMMKEKEATIFFELLHLQNNVLENLQGNSDKRGRQLLILMNGKLQFQNAVLHSVGNIDIYNQFERQNGVFYLHYIRAMQTTFAHIVFNKVLSDEEKETYVTIFKSQLSVTELTLWAYYIHMNVTLEDLKVKTIEYNLFNHLEVSHLHLDVFTGKIIGSLSNPS